MADVAQANADLKYGTLLDAIRRRIGGVQAGATANEQAIQGYGNTGRQVIGQTYDVLDKSLAGNRADTGQQLATSANNIGQGYRDAQSVLDTQRGIARDFAANAGLADNQGDAYARRQASLENVIADLIGRNAQQDATVTGNLKNWAGQMDSIFAKGQDIGHQQRADASGRFETSLLDALAGNRLNAQTDETDLQGQLLSTLNERGNFLVSESDRLANEAWQRALQQAQLSQSAQQANAELALRQRAMDREDANVGKDDYWKQKDYEMRLAAQQQGINESDRDYALRLAQLGMTNNDDKFKALSMLGDPTQLATLAPDAHSFLEATAGVPDTRLGQARTATQGIIGNAFSGLFNGSNSGGQSGYGKYNELAGNLLFGDRQPGIEHRLRNKLISGIKGLF